MNIISLANQQITYYVTYQKNRKSLQLKIHSNTHLEVTAPDKFPLPRIEKILQQKALWITKHLLHFQAVAENPVNKAITDGASIFYLGVAHKLVFNVAENPKLAIYAKDHQIFIPFFATQHTPSSLESLLKKWYWHQAQELLIAKTTYWSQQIKVDPKQIRIKEQKTRWGSCSSRGNINYNWRIIMAPPEVIDYLVIHELCHLPIPNHSSDFWQEVARFSPHFQQHRHWLKTNGSLLMNLLKK